MSLQVAIQRPDTYNYADTVKHAPVNSNTHDYNNHEGLKFKDCLWEEELLGSCGKASKTAFTMSGISSVVSGSFLLRFSAGKDLEDLARCNGR